MKATLGLLLTVFLVACGGGGGSETATQPPQARADNVVALTVEAGPGNNINIPYVTVTVCIPGSASCQTIERVLVDTGSTGLRLLASALTSVKLPAQTTSTSNTVVECGQFINFVTWGPVKVADVLIGDKRANSVPIQVVADPAYNVIPHSCGRADLAATSTDDLGANGVLGVGLFVNDGQLYYNCNPTSRFNDCPVNLTAAQQVQNPVALFASDNNGVVLQLPAVAAGGVVRVDGQMVFGIDTQPNNRLGNAKVIQTDASGFFTTTYKGVALRNSFIDSGSNGLYFDDAALAQCPSNPGFYCPTVAQSLSAAMTLKGNATDIVRFDVANAATLIASPNWVFNSLAGPSGDGFDWGLPFFLGRSVYTVIEGRSTSAGPGPLYAYTN
jgi:hypothetical protein